MGKFLLGVSHRPVCRRTSRPARVRESQACLHERASRRPSEKAGGPRTPVFGERVSNNVVLCQLEAGFQADLDISSALGYEVLKLPGRKMGQK